MTFLYKLEAGVAEGSFGMHCASMCGIASAVVDRAEEAAREWEHTSLVSRKLKNRASEKGGQISDREQEQELPLGILSDLAWILKDDDDSEEGEVQARSLDALVKCIEAL